MTARTWVKAAACIVAATALAAAAALFILPRLINLDDYRAEIVSSAETALKRRVGYKSASFSWSLSPTIVFKSITIAEKSGDAKLLEAERLGVKLALLPLLHHEVRLKEIFADRPVLTLSRDRSGTLSIDDLLTEKPKPSRFKTIIKAVRIRHGSVRFTDHLAESRGLITTLEGMNLEADGLARGETSTFKFSTRVAEAVAPTSMTLSGTVWLPEKGKSLRDAKINVKLTASNINALRYWPYYARYVPFKRLTGRFDYTGTLQGKPVEFTSKGELWTRGLRLDYPEVFHAVLAPRDLHLSYELALTPRDLSVKKVALNVDALSVKGSCLLRDIHSNDPRITAHATTSPFRLEEFHQYIPYGVIVKGPADFIEQHIKGGVYRLDDGKLDGRVSQICNMDVGDNYNVLYIRGRVDKGVVSYPDVPVFRNIAGELEMRGKDFILRGMTGNLGDSPFNLEGKIADYPLAAPAKYPFTMVTIPAKAEVAWLLGQKRESEFDFAGQSILKLSGDGTLDDYRLAGSWDLTRASYRHGKVMQKPANSANSLRFTGRLRDSEAELEALRFHLPPLDITAAAKYRYDARLPLSFSVQTNRFKIEQLLHVAPGLKQYRPSGSLEAHGNGSGNPGKPEGVTFDGAVAVADFSARPVAQVEALHDVNGTIHLTHAALETERLTGSVGSSPFELRGRIDGFTTPSADLVFSAPSLRPTDFGCRCTGEPPTIKQVSGKVALKDRKLNIGSLTGQINNTVLRISGTVSNPEAPIMDLLIDVPYLAVEDLMPLTRLEAGTGAGPGNLTVKARVTAAAGKSGDIPFDKLDTTLFLERAVLSVRSLTIGAFGGIITGNGKADLAAKAGPTYQARYAVAGVDAEELQHAADVEPYLTGSLTAKGELAGRGKSAAELLKSGRGTASVHLVDGEISLKESIPYKVVDADLSFKEQTLTVENLKAAMLGGEVSGNGRMELSAEDGPRYTASCNIRGVEAEQLQQAVGLEGNLDGKIDANGELTARGKSLAELEKSAQASAKIHLQKGELRTSAPTGKADAGAIKYGVLDADVSYGKEVLTVADVSAALFGGTIAGKGRVDFGAEAGPAYQLQYHLEHVDTAQLLRAVGVPEQVTGKLTVAGEFAGRGTGWEELNRTGKGYADLNLVDGVVNVAAGIPLKSLRSRLSLGDGKLGINATTIEAFGGEITGEGAIDYTVADGPGYRLTCDMTRINATDFFNCFRVTKELSGRLDLQAHLTARGESLTELEKSLDGTVEMHLKKGVINRYAILSKVFSILNVSQLFHFRLPDMVSNGMPYDRIDVNFSLDDGVASTKDLILTSASVNLTAVGKSDLVREEVDLDIGVQPLQTVGKVISRIPIIGWILTGKDKRFLVTNFKAKGSWDDPKVSTTTVTSLSEGVYNIFKRVFRLPDQLITKPGQVIMGN